MALVYLALGSNLYVPRRQLAFAINSLRALPRTKIHARSKLYFTKPLGPQSQPNYINAVIAIKTRLSPQSLLLHCRRIEEKQRRYREKIWGARSIDIDIILYEQAILRYRALSIPHPRLMERDFVLVPLLELSPDQCLPNGQKIVLGHDIPKTIINCKSW